MDCQQMIYDDNYFELITKEPITNRTLLNAEELCVGRIDDEIQIIYGNRELLSRNQDFSYPYDAIPKCYGLMQASGTQILQPFDPLSLEVSGILSIQQPPLSLTGRNVICAFLDTGIDYTHPIFRRSDGRSRILAIWDQTVQNGNPPSGYLYGTEFLQEQINTAIDSENPFEIVPSNDDIGHGSNLASIAAGSRLNDGKDFIGAAPDADIIMVKLKQTKQYLRAYYAIPETVPCYTETDILWAIKYLQECSVRFQKPIVICFGLGTSYGEHDGVSILAKYLDRIATKKNCAMLVCTGNEGNKAHHAQGILAQTSENVEVRVNFGVEGFVLEIWGRIPYLFQIGIRSPGGENIPEIGIRQGNRYEFGFTYESTRIYIDSVLTEAASGEQMMRLLFVNPTPGIWTITLSRIGNQGTIPYHMWLPIANFLTASVYFLAPNPYTTFTGPAGSREVCSITAYQDSNRSVYSTAGRGYTRTGMIKPDLAAPGVMLSSLRGKISGTGPATALAAGAVAQYFQWAVIEENEPEANTITAQTFLVRGARRDNIPEIPNREWGWGTLDVQNSFRIYIS